MTMEEDEIDAAWREFDCSWENVKKNEEKDVPKMSVSPSRRSGVRRGHDGFTTRTSIKVISVPTKCIDGPSPKKSIPRAA